MRLPASERTGIEVLDIELRWRDPAALDELLAPVIGSIGDDGRAASA